MKSISMKGKFNFLSSPHLARFVIFGIVGGSGFFVNMFFLWLFTDVFNIFYIISSIFAIAIAMINNFIWNDIWTWRGEGKPGVKAFFVRFLKFCLVASFAGFVGNLGVLWILTDFFNVYYLVSNIFGIAVGTFINYFFNHYWTFKSSPAID